MDEKEWDSRIAKLRQGLEVDEHSLTSVEIAQLHKLVEGYDDMFALHKFELGMTDICQHITDTGSQVSIGLILAATHQ